MVLIACAAWMTRSRRTGSETGSDVCSAVITAKSVSLRDARLNYLGAALYVLQEAGADITATPDELTVETVERTVWPGRDDRL
jgi:UDP-N-acetylglucosamine enolpyruvyl transferase